MKDSVARVGRWAGPGLLGAVAVAAPLTGAAYAAQAAWPALLGDPHDWVHDLLRATLALLVAVAGGRHTTARGAGGSTRTRSTWTGPVSSCASSGRPAHRTRGTGRPSAWPSVPW